MLRQFRLQLDRLGAKREASFDTDRVPRANKLLQFYAKIITKIIDAERCSVFINDPKQDKVWLKAGTGLAEHNIEVPVEGSIVGKVIKTGEPVIQSGLEQKEGAHKDADAKTGFVTRNLLCVPITSPQKKDTIGAIQVLNKRGSQGFGDEDVADLTEVAEHLQSEVAAIFLDQEIFGLSEKIYNAAQRTIGYLVGGAVVLVMILLLVILAYVVVPVVGG